MHRSLLPVPLFALLLAGTAAAAELGDVTVRSFRGQPLVADIELLPDRGGPVDVFLAHPDVFRGANVPIGPVLDSLHMSIMRRDGRQFLHLTSIRPVDEDHLILFFDLVEADRHSVRDATLWFAAEPPAPMAARAPAPEPSRAVAVAAARATQATPRAAARPAPARDAQACAELDYKNTELSAQIVELEDKVKALQAEMAKPTAKPTPRPLPRPLVGPAPTVEKPAGTPAWVWYAVAGAVSLAAAGGIGFVLRKRKPGMLAKFVALLKRKKAPEAPHEEPKSG